MSLRERSTADLLLLMVAGTVCAAVLLAGAGIVVLALVDRDRDLTASLTALESVITVMLGAVVGYLGGRGEGRHPDTRQVSDEPDPGR